MAQFKEFKAPAFEMRGSLHTVVRMPHRFMFDSCWSHQEHLEELWRNKIKRFDHETIYML